MSAPEVKGWCPGAHRPMMSGDGLVVRVRPFYGALDAEQVTGLCDLAERFGNGMLDLTSRANLQIRGVAEADHHALLTALDNLGVIDADPAIERHRNILMPPVWQPGDLTHRLCGIVLQTLPRLPDLPEKMGIAIDTGTRACLAEGSADIRVERDDAGGLVLRGDGAARGRNVTEAEVAGALVALATWFVETGGRAHGRMARHLDHVSLPESWTEAVPRGDEGVPDLGAATEGTYLGAPFGKIATGDLRQLMAQSQAKTLHVMLRRQIFLPGVQVGQAAGFETQPSRIMSVHACPGAPFCPQASVATLDLAKTLAAETDGSLHVSGCAKGCAHPRKAATTLVGREGRFDLVLHGQPWDAPSQCGLDPSRVSELARRI